MKRANRMYALILIISAIYVAGIVTGVAIAYCAPGTYRQRHARAPSRTPPAPQPLPDWDVAAPKQLINDAPTIASLTPPGGHHVAHAIGSALPPGTYIGRSITDFEGSGYVTIENHNVTVRVTSNSTTYEGDTLAVVFGN
jgi:hypothetical protein